MNERIQGLLLVLLNEGREEAGEEPAVERQLEVALHVLLSQL